MYCLIWYDSKLYVSLAQSTIAGFQPTIPGWLSRSLVMIEFYYNPKTVGIHLPISDSCTGYILISHVVLVGD